MKININSDKGNILTTDAYNLFSFRNVLHFATCYENKKSAKHYFDNFGGRSVKRLARLLLINREQTGSVIARRIRRLVDEDRLRNICSLRAVKYFTRGRENRRNKHPSAGHKLRPFRWKREREKGRKKRYKKRPVVICVLATELRSRRCCHRPPPASRYIET